MSGSTRNKQSNSQGNKKNMHGLIDNVFYFRKLNVDKKLSSLEALDDTHIMRNIYREQRDKS